MRRRSVLFALACGPRPLLAKSADPMARVLEDRLQVQGVGYAYARVDARGRHYRVAGHADSKGGTPVDADTWFELGSLTETFTALLLADAVLRGGFKLDDAVEAVLPRGLELRDRRGQPLRWVDLATHRSGLPRRPDNPAALDPADPYADYGASQLQQFIERWRPTRERGERYEPSSLGFGLLGHALALHAGRSYAELLTQRVLGPLGLDGMAIEVPAAAVVATGHDAAGRPVARRHFGVMAGAGALVGSTAAVARFAQAALGLFEHALGPAFLLCMQVHAAGPAPINPAGLAWLRAPLKGRTLFGHEGVDPGASHSIWFDPERRLASIVLGNAAVPVTDIALHALDAALPLHDYRVTRQPVVELTGKALAELAGSYRLNPGFALVFTVDAGVLRMQASGQGEVELFASAPRRFFARQVPLEIAFDGDSGPPAGLTLFQGGMRLRFLRER